MRSRFVVCASMLLCVFVASTGWSGVSPFALDSYSEEHGTLAPYTPPAEVNGTGKKLMAIYMVGSDLEGDGGSGTSDFLELIQGYNSLSSPLVDVIIAFGGSNKDGWKGMKFVTMSQLIADGQDEAFGNETSADAYLYQEDRAHMGDASSLTHFLKYVQEGYVNYDQRFLTFWDHGASYNGFGNDDNFNGDPMLMSEIDQGLADGGTGTWDLIGFDCCLMGSIEVATIIKKHADYMMASEETEPGHGWNWEAIINAYQNNSGIVDFAKAAVDNFVKDVHGSWQPGKTLSVLDLSKTDAVKDKLDTVAASFADALNQNSADKQAVIDGSTKSQEYGKEEKGGSRVSLDLMNIAQIARANTADAGLQQNLDDLMAELKSFIVHSRQDGTRPKSFGVTVTAPENEVIISETFGTSGMVAFQNAYKNMKNGDTTPPVVQEQNNQANANDVEFKPEEDASGDSSEGDPSFGEWLDTKFEELDQRYDAGEITDDQYDQLAEELENKTAKDPEYISWLAEYNQSSQGGNYVPDDWDVDWNDENGNSANSWASVKAAQTLPFMTGERSAFVQTSGAPGRGTHTFANTPTGVDGVSATFSDDNLVSVKTAFGNILSFDLEEDGNVDDWFLTISSLEAYPTTQDGQYFTPQWNRKWYFMNYDSNEEATYIPMYFDRHVTILGKEFTVYTSEIDYQDASVDYSAGNHEEDIEGNPVDFGTMEFIVSPSNAIVDATIRTYKIRYSDPDDEYGEVLYDKSSRKLKVGDKIRFYSEYINLTRIGYDFWEPESDLLTIAQIPTYYVDVLEFEDLDGNPLNYYYAMMAEDIADNITMTDPQISVLSTDTPVSTWELY